MDEIDWIQLWMLNELVCDGSRPSRLIHHPEEQSSVYWAFPARAVLRATAERRIEALLTCVEQQLIAVYPDSWFQNPNTDSHYLLTARECQFHNTRFVEETVAAITLSGHEKWEAEFQPDWGRFWSHVEGDRYDANSSERVVSVLYTSNQILDDLRRWFPSYWGLDKNVGLTQLECRTVLHHQSTSWKVLPWAKIITWKGQSNTVELNKLLHEPTVSGLPPQLKHYAEVLRAEHAQAYRVLSRLSSKWIGVDESPSDPRDAEPQVRVE
jgi:hypothetical protein